METGCAYPIVRLSVPTKFVERIPFLGNFALRGELAETANRYIPYDAWPREPGCKKLQKGNLLWQPRCPPERTFTLIESAKATALVIGDGNQARFRHWKLQVLPQHPSACAELN